MTEFVVLLVIALAVFGRPLLDAAQGSPARTARTPPKSAQKRAPAAAAKAEPAARREPLASPRLPRGETSVLILNGNGIAGAAAGEADTVRAKGYIIADVGNAKRADYGRSVIMYRPGYKPEAARLAHDLRLLNVSPLDGIRAGDLMGAHVAVVLGR